MSSRPTTIELNGKRYDARTGKIISAPETVTAKRKTVVKTAVKQPGTSIDGLAKRKSTVARSNATARMVHKKAEKSKTLMRAAVRKPEKAKAKPDAPQVVRRQIPRVNIDPNRASRAEKAQRSSLVSKFGQPRRAVTPISTSLPVRPKPDAPPVPVLDEHLKPTIPTTAAHRKSFQKAIDSSTSHNQPRTKKITKRQRASKRLRVSSRAMNLAAASLTAVLLVGFISYQNIPNLSMKIAATRAGVNGTLPDYHPAGFGLRGPIKYQDGQITLSYTSRSDDRAFQVSQKASQWNSETLLENYVSNINKTYQTLQDSGKTIYIYEGNNATWVDGGVWYEIEGNSALNNDQLLRMAASM